MATATATRTKQRPTTEQIVEFTLAGRVDVDVDKSVIRNVKLVGHQSRNGRTYTVESLRKAAGLYEGVKVNVDHGAAPNAPRSYADRIGIISNVRVQSDGLYGDLTFNPKHALAEQLAWDAKNAPNNVGLSHVVEGQVNRRNGTVVVEEITKVVSVDLVADPATTKGLHESIHSRETDPMSLTIEDVRGNAAIMEALRGEFKTEADADGALKKAQADLDAAAKEAKALKEQLDALTAKEAQAVAKAARDKLIEAAKMPAALVTDVFREQVYGAKDDDAAKALIEDRRKLTAGAGGTGAQRTEIKSTAHGEPTEKAQEWSNLSAKDLASRLCEA